MHFAKPEKVPWWLVLVVVALGGWLLVNATVYFYYEHLGVLVHSRENPLQELVDRWATDGAKRVFALFFGWLYGFIYSVPYFLVYTLASFIRRKRQRATSIA